MKTKVFQYIKILTFYIGVNVIGIPCFVEHKLSLYVKKENRYYR
jgi:hypothetical protein